MRPSNKPPIRFWVFSVLALIWNLLGVMAYLVRAFMTPEMMESTMSVEEITFIKETPTWVTAAFAVAVWGGALGSLFLLMRKAAAHLVFLISLLGIVVQMGYNFFVSNAFEVYGPGGSVMPIMVLLIGILLVIFSRKARQRAWIL